MGLRFYCFMYLKKCMLILSALFLCFLGSGAHAQLRAPRQADTAKKCAICHYRWVYTFYVEHRGTPLAPLQEQEVVGSKEMCLSCHDGSVRDSRDRICNDPGHQIGVVPSQHIRIPPNFPLDEKGQMQCTTCHTPHAVSFEEGLQFTFFLRKRNENSSFCKECHVEMVGGLEKGNHPIDIEVKKTPESIIKAGGKLGKGTRDLVICETCHTPHGGYSNQRLILPIEDPLSRSVLCEACHSKSPLMVKIGSAPRYSHPVDVSPGMAAQIPKKWSCGEDVFRGKGGVLVCRTCHKPHRAIDQKVLLADHNERDSLCSQCHRNKQDILHSSHDLKVSAPQEMNIQGIRAAESGTCSPCHLVHQGTERYIWARQVKGGIKNPDDFCTSCHAAGACGEKAVPKDYSHPIGVKVTPQANTKLLPLSDDRGNRVANGNIRCFTCHDVHNPAPLHDREGKRDRNAGKFLRFSPTDPSAVCVSCHKNQGSIMGTDHDLRITSPNYTNVLHQNLKTSGVCSSCHSAHNAPQKKFLWSAPLGPSRLDTWKDKIGDYHDSFMIQICTGCHAPGKNAEEKVPVYAFHPGALTRQVVLEKSSTDLIYYDLVNNAFPIYTDEGEFAEGGYIVCSTCHNPHVWKKGAEKGPGKEVEGGAADSFLRPDVLNGLCVRCHGEESIIKFQYFHTQLSREKEELPFQPLIELR